MVNTMKIGIPIDKGGRLVLPKEVRQKLVGIRRVDFDSGKTLLAREVLRCGRLVYSRKNPR